MLIDSNIGHLMRKFIWICYSAFGIIYTTICKLVLGWSETETSNKLPPEENAFCSAYLKKAQPYHFADIENLPEMRKKNIRKFLVDFYRLNWKFLILIVWVNWLKSKSLSQTNGTIIEDIWNLIHIQHQFSLNIYIFICIAANV